MKVTLILAAVYNIGGGLAIIFLLERIAASVHLEELGHMLFRLFTGGTAFVFGVAYASISKSYDRNRLVLTCGTALKYWAFLASLYCFLYYELSVEVLVLFGGINLVFAVLFTRHLLSKRG